MTEPSQRRAINEPPGLEAQLLRELLWGAPAGDSSLMNGSANRREKLLGRLTRLNLIDDQNNPTHLARDIAPFITGNIGVRQAIALGASRWYGTTWYTIKVVSILSAEFPFFVYPSATREEACAAHQSFETEGSESDLVTLVNAFDAVDDIFVAQGRDAASTFAVQNFLNFRTFLEIRSLIESLTETARRLEWKVEPTDFTEAELFATFFWGYLDRLLCRAEDTGRWQSVHRFFAEIQRDSLHHASRGGQAELILCVGLILKDGCPEGKTGGTSFTGTTPEAVRELVGDDVGFVIESHPCGDGEAEEPYEVWYWGDARLVTRECPMPNGTPLEVLQDMHVRSLGELPICEPRNGPHKPLSWADLARLTKVRNLQALVADAWLDFPDTVNVGNEQLPVYYAEDGTITVVVNYAQAACLLPDFSEEILPRTWSGRPVVIAVEGGGGEPLTCPLDELDALRQLFAEQQTSAEPEE
ncbi:MAG: hypothetical protein C5B53_10845 [Candidatus Melainabacteria bacterium]|nr:MAG: hypothetical protein C5B53_10845 [Candidatus Melainabacteria bacterium]